MRACTSTCLSLALFALAGSLAACSSSGGSGSASATAKSAPTTVGVDTGQRPQGGPAPPELQGHWLFRSSAGPLHLYLRENSYSTGDAHGNIVVDGDEVSFFNSNGASCPADPLPDAGRYKWRVSGEKLRLRAMGEDPCGGRADLLAHRTFVRAG